MSRVKLVKELDGNPAGTEGEIISQDIIYTVKLEDGTTVLAYDEEFAYDD